jgi:hypothetical protein
MSNLRHFKRCPVSYSVSTVADFPFALIRFILRFLIFVGLQLIKKTENDSQLTLEYSINIERFEQFTDKVTAAKQRLKYIYAGSRMLAVEDKKCQTACAM